MLRLHSTLIGGLALLAATAPAFADGDAANGEKVFKKCMACHKVGENAKPGVGPVLNGVVGRVAGTSEGYKYSPLNHHAGEAGLAWTEENMFAYLADPNGFLKKYLTDNGHADQATGATKMTFKLANEQERNDVIAYLKTFSPAQ
ncbi:MAG: cytochrome c family protein [Hyphomicrobiaceae bacterium]